MAAGACIAFSVKRSGLSAFVASIACVKWRLERVHISERFAERLGKRGSSQSVHPFRYSRWRNLLAESEFVNCRLGPSQSKRLRGQLLAQLGAEGDVAEQHDFGQRAGPVEVGAGRGGRLCRRSIHSW